MAQGTTTLEISLNSAAASYDVAQGQVIELSGVDLSDVSISQSGGDLVLRFSNGREVLLRDFVNMAQSGRPPVLVFDDRTRVSGADVVAQLAGDVSNLAPAAGDAPSLRENTYPTLPDLGAEDILNLNVAGISDQEFLTGARETVVGSPAFVALNSRLQDLVTQGVNLRPLAFSSVVSGAEDGGPIDLGLRAPRDLNGDSLTIRVTGLPTSAQGVVTLPGGAPVFNGAFLTAEQLTNLKFVPAANYNGIATFGYVVSDGQMQNAATAQVSVTPVNDAPVLDTTLIQNPSVQTGTTLTYTLPVGTATDIDSSSLTLTASLANGAPLPAWISFDGTTRTFTLQGDFANMGTTLGVRLTVTDAEGASSSHILSVTVPGATPGTDTLTLTSGNDVIDAMSGDDIVNAGGGDDTINGGTGVDQLYGEAGNDTFILSVDNIWPTSFVSYNQGNPGVSATGEEVVIMSTSRSYDLFNGGDGIDTLTMGTSNDTLFLHDTHSAQPFTGPRLVSIEVINAGAGDDVVDLTSDTYALGDLTVNGGDGADVIWSSLGNDTLNGGAGNDRIWGGGGNDTLDGGTGADRLDGSDGDDTLVYDAADTEIYGGVGVDTLRVTTTVSLSLADDKFNGLERIDLRNSSTDTLSLAPFDILRMSDTGTMTVNGNAGDAVTADAFTTRGDDLTEGGLTYASYTTDGAVLYVQYGLFLNGQLVGAQMSTTNADILTGSTGDDVIGGGNGNDILNGGAGNDTLVFDSADTVIDGGTGDDTLQALTSGANINLSNLAITGIERIALGNSGADTVTLTAADVLRVSDTDTLRILGDSGDDVVATGFTAAGSQTVDGINYGVFTGGGATLLVQVGLDLNNTPVS